jgi:LuxR family maltose regulon positive regulatory protein
MGAGPVEATILCGLAAVELAAGQLRLAWRTCERALELAPSGGATAAVGAIADLMRARIQYEWDDLDAAEELLAGALALLVSAGSIDSRATAYALAARIRQARGDAAGALDAIEEADGLAASCGLQRIAGLVSAHRARLWLAQGELEQVAAWAEAYQASGETEYLREFEDLTLARAMLASGQSGEAARLLGSLLEVAEAAGRVGSAIEMLALRAVCIADAAGATKGRSAPPPESMDALTEALRLARPKGYVRLFVDEGAPMRALLSRVRAAGPACEYVGRLLASFARADVGPRPDAASQQPLIDSLSPREIDVLRLLAEGLTNPEIGQRLFIALPTVKSHTSSIYGKLGVHRRRDAVARARRLGLLPRVP